MEGNFYCTVSDEITKKRLKRKSERFNIIVSLKLILIFVFLKKKLILHCFAFNMQKQSDIKL